MHTADLIEFLLILLIVASIIAFVANRFRIPYTVLLVLGGFAMDLFRVPIQRVLGQGGEGAHLLTPDIVFMLFLPALLFEAGLNLNVRILRQNLLPILLLAIGGVVIAIVTTGYAVHSLLGTELMPALVFGALISATDPVSVLALFKDLGLSKRLSILIEGESLFNDGTAVVLFQILVAATLAGGHISVADAIWRFAVVSGGGAALGLALGYAASRITQQIDDPAIEITLSMIIAYGSYLIAEHLHVSGVIATVMAALMVGSYGAQIGMTPRTRVSMWAYWEYVSFVINSLLFLLIGLEVHILDLLSAWRAIGLALIMVVAGRALSVYTLVPVSNLFRRDIPLRWQHLAVWGGIHGGVSIALALSLPASLPARETILRMTFGVVAFSIVVQGLGLKPVIRLLKIQTNAESDYDRTRVRAIAIKAAQTELGHLAEASLVSPTAHRQLEEELDSRLEDVRSKAAEIEKERPASLNEDLRLARIRTLTAEKMAIQRSVNDGLISASTASAMMADLDGTLERLKGSGWGEGDR